MELIKLENVTYTYPLGKHPAIEHVSLTLEQGKFYGIVGENASGKSTLCNVIRGLCPNFYLGELSGSVTLEGKSLSEIGESQLAVRLGYIFQNPFVQISGVRETVFEEVGIGLENLGIPKDEMLDRIWTVCHQLHIEELMEKNPMKLSGGQCQRVAFASIIAMDADIIVIDEPTSQLDPEGTEDVFEIIRLLKDQGKTILLVEHKIDLMAKYCDDLIVMKDGKVAAFGPTNQVLTAPDYADTGAPIPAAVELGYALQKAGIPLSQIPVTNEEAARLIRQTMGG